MIVLEGDFKPGNRVANGDLQPGFLVIADMNNRIRKERLPNGTYLRK